VIQASLGSAAYLLGGEARARQLVPRSEVLRRFLDLGTASVVKVAGQLVREELVAWVLAGGRVELEEERPGGGRVVGAVVPAHGAAERNKA
jgi:hypothetical protein